MKLTDDDTANILAALRFWQDVTIPECRSDAPHFGDGEFTAYTDTQIDQLCARINGDEIAPAPELLDALHRIIALVDSGSLEIAYGDRRATTEDITDIRALVARIEGAATT